MSKESNLKKLIQQYIDDTNENYKREMPKLCLEEKEARLKTNKVINDTRQIIKKYGFKYNGALPAPNEIIIRNYEECMRKAQQYNNQK